MSSHFWLLNFNCQPTPVFVRAHLKKNCILVRLLNSSIVSWRLFPSNRRIVWKFLFSFCRMHLLPIFDADSWRKIWKISETSRNEKISPLDSSSPKRLAFRFSHRLSKKSLERKKISRKKNENIIKYCGAY